MDAEGKPTNWEEVAPRDRTMVLAAIRYIESHYADLAKKSDGGLDDLETKKRAYALAAKRLEELPC